MRKTARILSWIGLFACMITIFSLSAQTGDESGELTKAITHHVVKVISPTPQVDHSFFDYVHHIVRKLGHASGYMLLALLASAAFSSFRVPFRERLLLVFLFCFLHAFSDEWHQTFVGGRAGEFLDVAIDTGGACFGMLLGALIRFLYRRRQKTQPSS